MMTPEQEKAVERVLAKLRAAGLEHTFSDEQFVWIAKVWQDLKDDLSNVSREEKELESAAWDYWFATAPRISLDENPVELSEDVAGRASIDAGAFDAAKVLAAEKLERGETLSPHLATFVAKILRGSIVRPQHGKGKRGLTDIRNLELAYAVWRLERIGIYPTKKSESDKLCGCDLVAELYDDLLANDSEGVILKAKGGEFSRARMRDIWLNEVKEWKEWQSCLPDDVRE